MDIEHQLVAGVEPPCEAVGLHVRRGAGLPKQEVAIGVERAAHNGEIHAGESFARRDFLQVRGGHAVHQQIGVMHQAAVAGRISMDFT